MNNNFRKAKAIEHQNKQRLLKVNPYLDEKSGIYILTREDEDGIRYAYIGQAKHILTRLAQHLVGYQHIDLSLRKHRLYSSENIHGWKIGFLNYSLNDLNAMEQYYIRKYANDGFQLRNKTSGSQSEGKRQIDEYRPSKGYHDGLKQGRKNLAKELSHIIEKHLEITLKEDKKNNKVSIKALEKFQSLLSDTE